MSTELVFAPSTDIVQSQPTGMMAAAQARESQEVQGAIFMAKQFPRDQSKAYQKIQQACKRPTLAAVAQYSYSRGGSKITGPSIRLAETLAQNWGNLQFEVREVSRRMDPKRGCGISVCQAYCWDVETNVRTARTFEVPHWRDTKQGGYAIKEERDIYELVANMGARRLRACILAIIPGDITEGAVEQCKITLRGDITDIVAERRKIAKFFADTYSVTTDHLAEFLGYALEQAEADDIVNLRAVATSMKDGADRGEFFPSLKKKEPTASNALNDEYSDPDPPVAA